MSLRGEQHRAAIRAVLAVFGDEARHFVFIGGCVLGLYARSKGAPLRATKDVDCVSTLTPWVLQEKILADLCSSGRLAPDVNLQCRYRIRGTDLDVDVISPQGMNIGGGNRWLDRAARRAGPYEAGKGRTVMAITPPFFLMTKLEAFVDRGPDAQSSKDIEDIVTLIVEVPDLVDQVTAEGLREEAAALWSKAFAKYKLGGDDLPDLVDWHLDQREHDHRERVATSVLALAEGSRDPS